MASFASSEFSSTFKQGLALEDGRVSRDRLKAVIVSCGVDAPLFEDLWMAYKAKLSDSADCEDFFYWVFGERVLTKEGLRADAATATRDAEAVRVFSERSAEFQKVMSRLASDLPENDPEGLRRRFDEALSAFRKFLKNVGFGDVFDDRVQMKGFGVDAQKTKPPRWGSKEVAEVVERPDFLDYEVTDTMKDRQKKEPAHWTLSISQWFRIIEEMKGHAKYRKIREKGRSVNMYRVNDIFIKPWTKGTGCGLSVLMSREKWNPAKIMLSHAWGEDMEELESCVKKHVKKRNLDDSAALWFCCFAQYQAGDDAGPKISEQLALDPFRSVIDCLSTSPECQTQDRGYGMLAIHTTKVDMYARLWCVYEIHNATISHINVEVSVSDEFIKEVETKMNLYMSRKADKFTFEIAAGLRINTAAAQCTSQDDYKLIVGKILEKNTNGFNDLDKGISAFRKGVLNTIFLEACSRDPTFLKFVDSDVILQVLKVVEDKPLALEHIPTKEWEDHSFAEKALKVTDKAWRYVNDYCKDPSPSVLKAALSHRHIAIDIVKMDGNHLKHASKLLQGDQEVVREAVKQDPRALEYADKKLKANPEVVLEAVKAGARLDEAGLDHASEKLRADRDFILVAVKENGLALGAASTQLRADREVVFEAVKQAGKALKFLVEEDAERAISMELESWEERKLGEEKYYWNKKHRTDQDTDPRPALCQRQKYYSRMKELRDDRDIVLAAIRQNGSALAYASEKLRGDRGVAHAAIKQHGLALKDVADALKDDRELVLEAVKQDGRAVQYASKDLRKDRSLVQEAMKQNPEALNLASKEVKDWEDARQSVKEDGKNLKNVSKDLRKDPDIVLEAVKQYGLALRFASQELKEKPEVVREAVKQDGGALAFASEALRADREIVLEAIKSRGIALHHASQELKRDHRFVLEAVGLNGTALYGASEDLVKDRDVVVAAVKQNGEALQYAALGLKMDYEIVLMAIRKTGYAFKYVSDEQRGDKQFVLDAVRQDGRVLKYASEALQGDQEVVLEAIKQNLYALQYASPELRADREFMKSAANLNALGLFGAMEFRNDREFVLQAVVKRGWVLQFASEHLRDDELVVLAAVKQEGVALKYASVGVRADREVVLTAVRQNRKALEFAAEELRSDPEVLQEASRQPVSAEMESARSESTYEIYIEGSYERFGIMNRKFVKEKYLKIDGICRGAVRDWNESHEAGLRVHDGDLIMDVNGKTGNAAALAMELSECTEAHIRFMRPVEQ